MSTEIRVEAAFHFDPRSRLRQSWNVRPLVRLMLFDLALLAGTQQYLLVAAQKQ